ncbi:hypothetical protein M0804_013246 [Polistes exclamans]|nr:hypothetical protein M0804_013246 [Polistes exclamans]
MHISIDSAGIGKCLLKKFNPKYMDFLHWLNNFEYIADIVHIPNNEMVEFLLSVIEPSCLLEIQKKVAPEDPHDLCYSELIFHFEELYGFVQGEWAANYRFVFRDQIIDESVLHYIYTLTKLLQRASCFLINRLSLLERFINGLKDENTKRILRDWSNLTLDKAVAIAAQLEFHQFTIKKN